LKAAHAGLLCNGESCTAIINLLKQLQRIAD
jgi:hypothetical protein